MNVYGVIGWKNAGKTTLVERLVAELTARGLSVSTVKHAHHDFDLDRPGKDSHRHREAGAHEVLVASARRFGLIREHRGAPEPGLDALVERMAPVDLVLVEGFKRDPHPKIEVARRGGERPLIAEHDTTVAALAADYDPGLAIPLLPIEDTAASAGFILDRCDLKGA